MGTEGLERGWAARTTGESKGGERCLRLPPPTPIHCFNRHLPPT